MRSKQRAARRSGCPISVALELFGDGWSLLVVRDMMFRGLETFNEFLAAGEGIASNILADRLARLECAGIIEKSRDPADGRRVIYRLTEKGIDLAPVLMEIVVWSARYERTDAPANIVRMMRDERERAITEVRNRWAQSAPGT